jgi:hypothetical protein
MGGNAPLANVLAITIGAKANASLRVRRSNTVVILHFGCMALYTTGFEPLVGSQWTTFDVLIRQTQNEANPKSAMAPNRTQPPVIERTLDDRARF